MHTDPDVLALVALGERDAATTEDLDHIAHCEVCGREVTELGHLSQVGRTISDHFVLETPSPEVWNRIRAQLGFGDDFSSPLVPAPAPRSTPPVGPTTPSSPDTVSRRAERDPVDPPSRRTRWILSLTLAAVLALLAGIGGTLIWQRLQPGRDSVVAAVPLNAMPDWAGASGEAKLEQDADGHRWLVVSMATPRPVDGVRQVWLMKPDATAMVPVGAMTTSPERLQVPDAVDVRTYPVVDVSVQPAAGPPEHSGHSIVRGTLHI